MDSRRVTGSLSLLLAALSTAVGVGCRMAPAPHPIEKAIQPNDDIAASQQQVRLRMRALVEPMSAIIVESADQISAGTTNRTIQREALVWKLEAVPALREALFRPNPFVACMDTWVLTWQMTDYFESGRGKEAFGEAAPGAVLTCQKLEAQIARISSSLTRSGDVSAARKFARDWAAAHPIGHSIAGRESTLSRVTEHEIQETFSAPELAGAVAVTLDDLSRRLDVYSAQLPEQSRWHAELLAMDLAAEYRLEQMLPLAESAVRMTGEVVEGLRRLDPPVEEVAAVARSMTELIRREREVTLEHVTRERRAALAELHRTITAEREALTVDLERISAMAVDRVFVRSAQLMGATLATLFLGMIVLLFITRRVFFRPQENL